MDLATLIKGIMEQLKETRAQFDSASSKTQKKAAYDRYLEAVEKLHKVYKANATSETAMARIKEILTSAVQDAGRMKENLSSMASHVNPKAPNNNHNQNNNNRDKSPHGPSKDDKDDLSGALSGAIVAEKPNVKWEDVAGLENAKTALREAIILPTKFPDIFIGLRKPWKGILLYGVS